MSMAHISSGALPFSKLGNQVRMLSTPSALALYVALTGIPLRQVFRTIRIIGIDAFRLQLFAVAQQRAQATK